MIDSSVAVFVGGGCAVLESSGIKINSTNDRAT